MKTEALTAFAKKHPVVSVIAALGVLNVLASALKTPPAVIVIPPAVATGTP